MKEEEKAGMNILRWSQKTIPPHHSKSRKWYVLPKLADWQWSIARLLEQLGDNKEAHRPYHHIKYYHIIMHGIWDYVYPFCMFAFGAFSSVFQFKNGKQGFVVTWQSWDDGGDDDTTQSH